jgi:ABC-type dipeptide/oligopeptide/nickel transport system ATPase subunit
MTRQFTDTKATRSSVPLLLGLTGASGSGKTYSALRLASGIRRVVGGEIFVIDTESKRSLHYADEFDFRHIEFLAPFSPLDYLAAIEHCVDKGAKTIVVDSCSNEHEGIGGVLDWHDRMTDELAAKWKTSREKVQLTAWGEPKAARRKLINRILQLGCNGIFCFRAKEKIKPPPKGEREIQTLGWMPIAGEEWVYEMTANCLLYPGSKGRPTWNPELPGERQMTKLPGYLAHVLNPGGQSPQLSEDLGELMAKWAAGADPFAETMQSIRSASNREQLASCAKRLKTVKAAKSVTHQQYHQLTDAWRARQAAIESSDNDAAAGAQADGESEVDHQESIMHTTRDPGQEG